MTSSDTTTASTRHTENAEIANIRRRMNRLEGGETKYRILVFLSREGGEKVYYSWRERVCVCERERERG
jgi:hypothetical protein